MAEMNDRGQLILVAGILLAVLFIALALLVNAAIYTDNVATRGGDSACEVLEYQAGVTDSIGGLIDAENAAASGGDDFNDVNSSVAGGISEIDAAFGRNNLRRSASTDITIVNTTEGRLIRERNANDFESWEANASDVRRFVIDLDTDNMTTGSPLVVDLDGTELKIINKTGGEVKVNETGGTECTTNATGTVRFDVTGERLDGATCQFGWPDFDTGSTVGIENGTYAGGSYELTIKSDDDPAWLPSETTRAVYSANIKLRMDTPDLRYETTVTVAPGEPDV